MTGGICDGAASSRWARGAPAPPLPACCWPTTARASSRSNRPRAIACATATRAASGCGTAASRASSPICGRPRASGGASPVRRGGRGDRGLRSRGRRGVAGRCRRARQANDRLVYCSVKGFGSSGPYAALAAYEGVVAAKAGVYSQGCSGSGTVRSSSTRRSPAPVPGTWPSRASWPRSPPASGPGGGRCSKRRCTRASTHSTTSGRRPGRSRPARRGGRRRTRPAGPSAGGAANRYSMFMPTRDGRWMSTTQMLPHQAHALRACRLEHTFDDPRFVDQPQFANAEDAPRGRTWSGRRWCRSPTSTGSGRSSPSPTSRSSSAASAKKASTTGRSVTTARRSWLRTTRGPVGQVGPVARFASTPSRHRALRPRLGEQLPEPPPPARRPDAGRRRVRRRTRSRGSRSSSSATSTPCPSA